HGSLAIVRCLACDRTSSRDGFQERLRRENAVWAARYAPASGPGDAEFAPDGDADLRDDAIRRFRVPACVVCGGVLKPDVVFFGANVPRAIVADAWSVFGAGDILLVLGSSLTVYSGRRFIYRAGKDGIPIA